MRTLVAALVACIGSTIAHADASVAESARAQALLEYAAGHYVSASAHFAVAAEHGDRAAAETLALMYRFGERLYGEAFRADPFRAAHWATVAVRHRRAESPEHAM